MAASLPATHPRVVKSLNPVEMICPASATGTITKYLVLRNSLPTEVALKLVLSPEAEKFMTLESKSLRLKGNDDKTNCMLRLKVSIEADRITAGAQLKGFVRAWHPSAEVENWMKTTGKETKRQLAFSMNIRKANVFSARDTVLDLPGSAVVFTEDDKGTETARAIEEDCLTARNCESIADYMAEIRLRKMTTTKKTAAQTNWGIADMASSVAETVKSWYEATPVLPDPLAKKTATKKTSTKKKTDPGSSGRSTSIKKIRSIETNDGRCKKRTVQMETEYVNHEMKATPCGGEST